VDDGELRFARLANELEVVPADRAVVDPCHCDLSAVVK
jgi:hypothetical protein